MIYVRLMGGLGNQMFQYAAGRRLAISHGTYLVLDLSHLENQPSEETPRFYELNTLKVKAKTTTQLADKKKKSVFKKKPDLLVIQETGLDFDKNILALPDNVLLIGYWQSYKYFQDAEKQIREDFAFKSPLSSQKEKELQAIKAVKDSVAVQVRRGDYATNAETNKFHGLIPLDYYKSASRYMAKKLKTPHFFVISDDSEWCEKNLKLDYPVTFIKSVPGTGHEDMQLMSKCSNHIIANSSFGWWGAWLCDNQSKKVIAPKQWFKGTNVKMDDRLPPGWTAL